MTMTDFYQTLGVSETASQDEIKKAYRKLANQHHPDKGGDQQKFKDISVAYDTLGDAQKRADYDNQRRNPFGGQHHFHSGDFQHFQDIFQGHFDPFGHRSNPFADIFGRGPGPGGRPVRNKDLNIQCQITLLDSFQGKQLEANYRLPSGKMEHVNITIPAGVVNGDTIRYSGLGDNSVQNAPRGNLNVTIIVTPDPKFSRLGDDLYTTVNISPIEAMIGCRKTIKTITGQTMDLEIRSGVETGVEFASHGTGFPNVNSGLRGRFVSVINIKSVSVTDPAIIARLKDIDADISKTS